MFVLARNALLLAALVGAGSATAQRDLCPTMPARRVVGVLNALPSDPKEAAEIATALDSAMMDSRAINTEVTLIDGKEGKILAGPCGFIDEPALRTNLSLRRTMAVNPLMKAFSTNARRSDTEPLDLVKVAGLLARYATSKVPTSVVIHAPLLRDSARDAATSFKGGWYASDGHLSAPRVVTTLSIVGRTERLKGIKVYLATTGDEAWANDTHRELVTRFWVHYFAEQGAMPVSVNASLQASFMTALRGEGRLGDDFAPKVDTTAKPEMINVLPADDPVGIFVSPTEYRARARYNAPINQSVGTLVLGLVWTGCADCDLDLYAAPEEGANELYYARNRIPGVGYLKKRFDDGNLKPEARGYEWITFEQKIDIQRATVWVNFYELVGATPQVVDPKVGVSGEVRARYNGADYAMPFAIHISSGNFGKDRYDLRSRRKSPYWVEIDLRELMAGNVRR